MYFPSGLYGEYRLGEYQIVKHKLFINNLHKQYLEEISHFEDPSLVHIYPFPLGTLIFFHPEIQISQTDHMVKMRLSKYQQVHEKFASITNRILFPTNLFQNLRNYWRWLKYIKDFDIFYKNLLIYKELTFSI